MGAWLIFFSAAAYDYPGWCRAVGRCRLLYFFSRGFDFALRRQLVAVSPFCAAKVVR